MTDNEFEPYRRELHVHCYRMLGSFDEAEDLVQETFLRAWRARDSYRGEAGLRAWLYRIATNACLDAVKASKRRVQSVGSFAEVPWLQPYPDQLLDDVVAKETIELAFVAVIQLLPPRQRSVLILRDVLDWSANETAEALGMSVPAANSALQRARATLEERLPQRGSAARTDLSDTDRALLQRLLDAHEQADVEAAVAVMREDVRVTMPPNPWLFDGLDAVRALLERGLGAPGDWQLVPTRANRMPAFACYLHGRPFKLDVVRLDGGGVAEITTFTADVFAAFGLPAILDR
jgi:RNA polymerase sigma-70 factor (TIGR02960 family)